MKKQPERRWHQFIWRRKEVLRTTWVFRLVAGLVLVLAIVATHQRVLTGLGESLVHRGPVESCQAIVLEHYGSDYLVFEMARDLQRDGLAPRVIVPCQTFGGPTNLNAVSEGIIDVMTRVSRMRNPELVPLDAAEPYTLNTAQAMAEYMVEQGIQSVIVVSPLFRSRRSHLVYASVLEPLGIELFCVPSKSNDQPDDWWQSTHGIQDVGLEFGKLWYYRLFVL